jgi:hypothetical protein
MATAKGTITKHGVRYRNRLLFKSHIDGEVTARLQAQDNYFACLFCVQTGSTVREGDATVFKTGDDLVRHLSRHPQPLPAVPGMTVLYGAIEAGHVHANDFDLHFPDPPQPAPVPENVAKLAVARSTKEHIQWYGFKRIKKPSGYDGEMLEFFVGARIVGVTYPEKWEGKWCLGRHDGKFGAFPSKYIQLRPPPQSNIPFDRTSGMSVTAKWKWMPDTTTAEGFVWLEFDKGEVISDVRGK